MTRSLVDTNVWRVLVYGTDVERFLSLAKADGGQILTAPGTTFLPKPTALVSALQRLLGTGGDRS
jgi:hypothetical protein